MMRSKILICAIISTLACTAGCAGVSGQGREAFVPSFGSAAVKGHVVTVTSTADTGAGSLRQAAASAAAGSTIAFDLPASSTIVLRTGPIALSKSLAISGPGRAALAISANGASQLFTIGARAVVTISGLTLEQGIAPKKAPLGGAIFNGGTLTLRGDAFSLNVAGDFGGDVVRPRMIARPFDPHPSARNGRAPKPPPAPSIPAPRSGPTSGQGAVVYNAATLTVDDSTFANNSVLEGSGGAIYNASHATLHVTGSTFTKNEGAMGGAIYNAGSATVTTTGFDENTGWPGSGTVPAGGYGYGAAIYDDGNLTVATSSFSQNVAGGRVQESFGAGGAVAEYGGSVVISGSSFVANVAGGGSSGSWGTGGALYVTAGTLKIASDTFESNRAGGDAFGYGGAVYADQPFASTKDVFTANTAFGTAQGGYAYGGGVYASEGLTLVGGSFSKNTAIGGGTKAYGYAYGGALDSEGSANLTSTAFTANVARGGLGGTAEGGAVCAGGGTSKWSALTFSENQATSTGIWSYSAGGAAITFSKVTVELASTFSSNSATSTTTSGNGIGGAVAVEVGPFSFAGTSTTAATAEHNVASTEGGAFWFDDVAALTNSLVSANKVAAVQQAGDGGGGIYVSLGGVLTMTGSTLSSNSTAGAIASTGGGGLFNAGSGAVSNSTFAANTSSVDGGGIESDTTTPFTLTNVTVYENVASSQGGSLKNLYYGSTMTVGDSILAGGTGQGQPNDISNDGTLSSSDYNIIQTAPTGNVLSGTTTHNLTVDPRLSALANNGGPTPTAADGLASPGTARIPDAVCDALGIVVDQRGMTRNPNGSGLCDVGAFENQSS